MKGYQQIRKHIMSLPPNTHFSSAEISDKLNVDINVVKKYLQYLRKQGICSLQNKRWYKQPESLPNRAPEKHFFEHGYVKFYREDKKLFCDVWGWSRDGRRNFKLHEGVEIASIHDLKQVQGIKTLKDAEHIDMKVVQINE